MLNKRQTGFTLVEIAIVLVIVGLLIGGVLKGQEMITNAKLKRVESDNAGILAALYSYQDRYLQLPGDDDDAVNRFTIYTGSTVINGNGNGLIGLGTDWEDSAAWADGLQETTKFFGHLRAAGLISGGANDQKRPTNSFGGQIGVQQGSLEMVGQVTIFGGLEGAVARILDGRLDDGAMNTGRVRATIAAASPAMNDDTPPSSAGYSDTENYHVAFRL